MASEDLLVGMNEGIEATILFAQVKRGKPLMKVDQNGNILRHKNHPSTGSAVLIGDVTDTLIRSFGPHEPPSFEKIPKLKPAFDKDGTVTAANSSSISDGAAALVMMRESIAKKRDLKPIARVLAHSSFAHEPAWFTTAPVGAIRKLLKTVDWNINDVDLFEINEAFAVVTMAAMKDLNLPAEKVNVHGGACALGHPVGASGTRILVTLISALQKYNKTRGIASLCIGGGEATAMAVEVLS